MINGFPPERRGSLNGIEKDTFQGLDSEDKLNVLFDYHVSMHNLIYRLLSEQCPRQQQECGGRMDKIDKRVEKLEGRKWISATASAAGGVVGGFVALVSKWLITGK